MVMQILGSVTLGDTANDNVTFNAVVDSNIIPSGTGATYNLGSSAQKWGTVSLYRCNRWY